VSGILKEGERLDRLLWGGLRIIQSGRYFSFALDSVLLAWFANIGGRDQVADLGCGTGVLSLLLSARAAEATFTAIEIMPELADAAARSVAINNLDGQIKVINGDLSTAAGLIGRAGFDLVVCNPPYRPVKRGKLSPNPLRAAARSEVYCTLQDVIRESSALLKPGGKLALVYLPGRLEELLVLLGQYGLSAARLRLVQPSVNKGANIVLLEAVKGSGGELKLEPTWHVYEEDGTYSAPIKEIFNFQP